jgi:hypothetical protein
MILKNYCSNSELVDVLGRLVDGFGDEAVFYSHCFY